LKFPLTRLITCLDPRELGTSKRDSVHRMKNMLPILVEAGRIQGGTASCDEILAQFKEFTDVVVPRNKQDFVSFSEHDADQRIDELYFKFMSRNSRFDKLWMVIK